MLEKLVQFFIDFAFILSNICFTKNRVKDLFWLLTYLISLLKLM